MKSTKLTVSALACGLLLLAGSLTGCNRAADDTTGPGETTPATGPATTDGSSTGTTDS